MRKVIQNFVTGGTLAVSLAASLSMMAPPRLAAEDASSGGQCESDNYGEAVLGFEGGGNQYATNPNSTATGSYQFLFGTLVELGYIEAGQSRPPSGAGDWAGIVWTGQDGVYSRDQFMASTEAQDAALERFTSQNLSAISGSYEAGQVVDGVPMSDGGAALAAHMLGAGGFNAWGSLRFRSLRP